MAARAVASGGSLVGARPHRCRSWWRFGHAPPIIASYPLPILPTPHRPAPARSLFCATILFATEHWLGYLFGALTALNAAFNGYVICVHPAFRSGELSAGGDPFGGYSGGEQEMLAYLKANPELAKKAGAAAVSVAQHNPGLAMQVAAAGAGGGQAAGSNPWGGGK